MSNLSSLDSSSPFDMLQKQPKYVFPCAYGGPVYSDDPPMIHNMMKQLRLEVGAVEAVKSQDKYGPKFPVRGAKDLAQKLANALNKLNMEAPVVAQEVTFFDTDKIPDNQRQSGTPVFRTLAHVKATVRLIAPDTSFIDMVGSGHGGDVDDKSGGKASTYAWKDALLKGLSIPHEDMVDTDDDSSTGDEKPAGIREAGGKGTIKGRTNARGESYTGSKGAKTSGAVVSIAGASDAEVGENSEAGANEEGLAYVLAQIKKADSKSDLEQIRENIKSGVMYLEGQDRLRVTKAWMERSKEIKEESE